MQREENRSLMLRTDGCWRILQHSNKRMALSRGEGWRWSALVFINNPSVRWASNSPQRWSACFCLHTLLAPAAQTRPAHESAASAAPRGCQTGARRHVQSRSHNQQEGAHPLLTEQEVLCLWILRGVYKLPRGAGGQQGEKNIMKLKTSSRLFF